VSGQTPAPAAWQRTKIICTLGPANEADLVLAGMIRAGMDVARINTAHGTPEGHAKRIAQVRRIAAEVGRPVAILVDLPGPKLRLGPLPGGSLTLKAGEQITLSVEPAGHAIPVAYARLNEEVRPGEQIFLSDGEVALTVQRVEGVRIVCRVENGGAIRSNSGMNLPTSELSVTLPTEEDTRNLKFAIEQKAEWVGVSFVQSLEDLQRVRALLPQKQAPLLMAKIERRQAVINLKELLGGADGVMVARGDLGVEIDLAEVPLTQKRIVHSANAKARPAVIATQMLDSMVASPRPTRAEVTDVANAILDGADAVMLSDETAIGSYPVGAVEVLHRVIRIVEGEYPYGGAFTRFASGQMASRSEESISFVASRLSFELGAKAILLPTADLRSAARIAQYRPKAPIIAITDSEFLCGQLSLLWGVVPHLGNPEKIDECVAHAQEWLTARGWAKAGDPIVLLKTSRPAQGFSDTLQVVHLA